MIGAAGLGIAASPAAAAAGRPAVAPGRVIFPVDGGLVSPNVDSDHASLVVALPDGGAVVGGAAATGQNRYNLAAITPTGALDPTFGTGGIAHVTLPSAVSPLQLLRQADGRLILIGGSRPSSVLLFPVVTVVRLTPNGALDPTFGAGGVAPTPASSVAYGENAALAPNGDILIAGSTGQQSTAINHDPNAVGNFKWVVTALTPSGALDTGFGQAGLVTIPAAGQDVRGDAVTAFPDGSLATLGEVKQPAGAQPISLITRLTATGAPDPAFNGGAPAALAGGARGSALLAEANGSLVVAATNAILRYTAAGAPDPGFGSGGVAPLGMLPFLVRLFPVPGGGVLVAGQSIGEAGAISGLRLTSAGVVDTTFGGSPGINYRPAFGGGGTSFLTSVNPRPLPPLTQDSFFLGDIAQRPDGSLLAVGGVNVSQPTGEGDGYSIFDFAVAALSPTFTPVTGFGGPASAVSLKLSLPAQRAATAHSRHGVRVTLNQSVPGIARVYVRAGGKVIAQSVVPIFGSGSRTLPVELTHSGAVYLRTHRNVRVTASASGRDLLTATATATGSGTLK